VTVFLDIIKVGGNIFRVRNIKICVPSQKNYNKINDEKCPLLDYYAASSGNFLPTFRDNLSGPILRVFLFLDPEGGTDMLSRNVGKKFPLLGA